MSLPHQQFQSEHYHPTLVPCLLPALFLLLCSLVCHCVALSYPCRPFVRINAARRQREAAIERAEAEKIMAVRAAEADAEAKHLSGKGTAAMRQAITEGFRGSIESMKESCGLEPKEVIHMMMVTQYLDVLKEFASSGKASLVVPHGISAVSDIEAQVRNGFMQANMQNAM